ncbi:hypothetical protein PV343_24025 [Streptomyces sp. WI03-4A]|uniref:hypothetical protein n=1 Tax=Streptomyces sp. WI03-4A TaxID=3028706 RepID=UPI0029A3DC9B|nr:hypothetical protein [Streptomyces sp. WI03-4A]MDX2595290.1 hypothetical protein [Streptomyces sp. WI03-4A]
MDWLSPLSGLVGAIVGAAASYLGTHQAQARAIKDARQSRVEAKQDAAVLLLSNGFAELHKHIRSVPESSQPHLGTQALQELAAAQAAWDRQLRDLLGPVRIAVEAMRDKELRHRLQEGVSLLEQWEYELEYAYFQSRRAWVLGGIVDDAVACVGAWQREDAMPEPNNAYRRAKESVETHEEEWRLTLEAQEEDRREQARREGRADP